MSSVSAPEIGYFYFIDPKLLRDCPSAGLMYLSKDSGGHRPCLCVARTAKLGVYWMVPLSSKTDKYSEIYRHKISKRGVCDTLVFGYVMGQRKTFLIQNIFPVTAEYVQSQYLSPDGSPIICGQSDIECVISRSNKILSLENHGFKIVFTDIEGMLERLSDGQYISSRTAVYSER